MGQAKQEREGRLVETDEEYAERIGATVTETKKGQVPEILAAIEVEIGNLEEAMCIVLTPEQDEPKVNMPQNPSRSGMVLKLDSIFRRLRHLNKRLDL